jgi:MFS family permease
MQQSTTDPWPTPGVAWYGLAILLMAFLVSAIDRVILGMLIIPIKADLGVSDSAMGALLGISFAVAFTLMGLLAGWLADRYSRRGIVSIAIAFWSLATAACGFASSFLHLLIGRVAVASGEAALSPAAFSLISDYFPPKKLGRALGVYMSGAFVGAGISFLVGGAVLSMLGGIGPISLPIIGDVAVWQVVFLVVGLPGLIVAALATTIKEPVRRGVSRVQESKAAVFGNMALCVWQRLCVCTAT